MATKTFQAETMMEVLKQVQAEMGPEAIVLSVRDILFGPAWQVRKKSGVEVVVVTPDMLNSQGRGQENRLSSRADSPDSQAAKLTNRGTEKKQPVSEDPSNEEEMPVIEWEDLDSSANHTKRLRGGVQYKSQPADPTSGLANKGCGWQPQVIRRESPEPAPKPVDSPAIPDQTARPVAVTAPVKQYIPASEGLAVIQRQLLLQGVDREFVERLAQVAANMLPASAVKDEAACRAYIGQQLEAELLVQPRSPLENGRKVLALVGASGSGKTSTVAKLAYFYQNVLHRQVMWVSADTIRMGAIAETRAYTEAIGVPLELVYAPGEFAGVMEKASEAQVVLLDTPGFNPYCESQLVELGEILTNIPERITYLVAPATTKDADLSQTLAAMGLYSLKGLVITRLDETLTYGNVFNLALKTQAPLTFFCSGAQANGGLQVAEASRLVNALFGKGWLK